MSKTEAVHNILTAPFRALWGVLTKIASLDRKQVRSLVTVGFLLGMMSLSAENWMTTWYLNDVLQNNGITAEKQRLFFGFLSERMRYTSILQGVVALALTCVILNADRMSFKAGGVEASVGGET